MKTITLSCSFILWLYLQAITCNQHAIINSVVELISVSEYYTGYGDLTLQDCINLEVEFIQVCNDSIMYDYDLRNCDQAALPSFFEDYVQLVV